MVEKVPESELGGQAGICFCGLDLSYGINDS